MVLEGHHDRSCDRGGTVTDRSPGHPNHKEASGRELGIPPTVTLELLRCSAVKCESIALDEHIRAHESEIDLVAENDCMVFDGRQPMISTQLGESRFKYRIRSVCRDRLAL